MNLSTVLILLICIILKCTTTTDIQLSGNTTAAATVDTDGQQHAVSQQQQQQQQPQRESFKFIATVKHPRSTIFGIEVYTLPEATVRCISWLYHDLDINVESLHKDFWFYKPNTITKQCN